MIKIKHPKADRLARLLAQQRGETITDTIIEALCERWLREKGKRAPTALKESLLMISQHCAQLPDRNLHSVDAILGYDKFGLPK